MKEITTILLIIIALIGIISIVIVKLYYRDKEKDDEKERLEEFINSTKTDYDNEKRKRVRRANKTRADYSEAQNYANTIDSSYNTRKGKGTVVEETENMGGTAALLRQRAKAMEEAPKKQVRRVRKAQAGVAKKPVATKKVPRTPERVQTQMNKEEEVKAFQEPIKPEHTATINSAKQKETQPKARQVPMTEKQKEFIAKDSNKLVVEDSDSSVKVVKSVLPADTIEEIKESAKIEDTKVEEDDIVKKAEADTAELIQKIEEAKVGVEKTLSTEKGETAKTEAEEIKEEAKEIAETEAEEIKVEAEEEVKETPDIESTIEKIKQVSKEKEEAKEEVKEEAETKEEKPDFIDVSSKVSEQIEQTQEEVYKDDLHILLNKDEPEEVDTTPENEFITINSDDEEAPTGNDLINNAIKSIRNFRKPNVPEKPVVVETIDDVVPDDYAQDLGGGIEYIGDTITITPIHEEEERDLVHNQPNEDVDKIYKEINKESYNKTDDEELSDSFEDVDDDTSEKDANVYTKEDYKKVEAKEREKKRRAENTKKILGSKGISEEELRQRAEAKARSKRVRKTAVAEKEPVAEGQKTLNVNKARNDIEEVYINGTLFELKVGQIVMFDIKGETYSSQILKLKPGYIGVRYRSKKIWVKSNTVKKILK